MSSNYDIVAIGDTTLDVFLEIDDATVLCDHNEENCKLCISYADKVPLQKVTKVTGVGNSANFAVGASRLGLETAIYTILGNDTEGKEIERKFRGENVSTEYISFDQKRGTNYSAVISFKGERTILVFHEKRDYLLPDIGTPKWIYFSSVSKGHEALHKQIVDYLENSNGVNMAFNPGTFQLREGLEKLLPILVKTSVRILNKEEAAGLLGQSGMDIKDMLSGLSEKGAKIVAITDGHKGSYMFDGKNFYFIGILDAPVVERTGCGDSYSVGFVSALAYGKSLQEAMVWGTVNASSVVQHVGAQKGLLGLSEMKSILDKNRNFLPKKI